MCPFWNVLFLECAFFGMCSFWNVLFLECVLFGMCPFCNVPFLECALFGMCLIWNKPFLECAIFGMCPFWNVPFLEYAKIMSWEFLKLCTNLENISIFQTSTALNHLIFVQSSVCYKLMSINLWDPHHEVEVVNIKS